MNSLDQIITDIRTNVMRKMLKFTDPQYYLLKFKPNPDADETKFLELYENIYLMQGISLLALMPSLFYLIRAYKYRNQLNLFKQGFTQQGCDKLNKRAIFYLSFGTVLAINSQLYQYKNDFSRLFKQIRNRQKMAIETGQLIAIQ